MKRTVINMLRDAARNYPDTAYLSQKSDKGWVGHTYPKVLEDAAYIASALYELGLKKDDKIAILSEGRVSWVVGEYGMLMAGCVGVPLSIKLLPEEVQFRLDHSESKAIILSTNTFDKVASIWSSLANKDMKIIFLDDDLGGIADKCKDYGIDPEKDIYLFKDMLKNGKDTFEKNKEVLEALEESIDEEDTVTICYTSGTTGNPKGIMLSHKNYFANSNDAAEYFNVDVNDRLLIILPLDHSFAHTVGIYLSTVRGLSIYFVDARGGGLNTIKNIPINIKETKPNFMLTVPALSGNFMNKIIDGIESKGGFAKWLFNKGLRSGMAINRDGYQKAGFFTWLWNVIPYKLASSIIFKKLKPIFGGEIKFMVGGGALLDVRQQTFFYAIGMPVFQGYGLTEATPIISANTPAVHKLGSSGMVLPNMICKIIKADGSEAKVGEKGEIVIKGDNVMKGYYKNKEATDNTIKGDWLYTGDLGYYDEDGFLVVVGREKALLISQDGEKYSPEGIEEAIQNCSEMVNQAMIYNDMQKYTSAIITLNKAKVEKFIQDKKISSPEVLLMEIKGSLLSFKDTNEYRNVFPEKWMPTTFQVVEEAFSEQNHMINSTMKMVRHKIIEAYKDRIDYMYTNDGANVSNEKNIDVVKKYLPFQ